MPLTLEEKAELDRLLEWARRHHMSEDEIEAQSIGWIIGNSPEGHRQTEEQVRESLRGLAL